MRCLCLASQIPVPSAAPLLLPSRKCSHPPHTPHPAPRRFLTSWLLALLTVAIIPPVFLLFWAYGRLSRRYVKEQLAASAAATTVAEECFSNLRTVRYAVGPAGGACWERVGCRREGSTMSPIGSEDIQVM